jgi:hypothetical protein
MTIKEIAERLAAEFEESGVPDDALDDMVHDKAQEYTVGELNETEGEDKQEDIISWTEVTASYINNGGFEEQILYLLKAGVSEEDIRKEVK